MTPADDNLPADAEHQPTREWLDRLGGDELPVTPLLAARVAVRRRMRWITMASIFAPTIAFLLWVMWRNGWSEDNWPILSPTDSLVASACACLTIAAAYLFTFSYQGVADRRIADTMPRPVARSAPLPLRTLLGVRFMIAAPAMYISGAGITATILIVADKPNHQVAAITFLTGGLLSAGFAAAVLSGLARRPIVADDEMAVRADALLHFHDVHEAVASYMIFFIVLQVTIGLAVETPVMLALNLGLLVPATCLLFLKPPAWITRGDAPMPVVVTR